MNSRNFASDNNAGVSSEVLKALATTNVAHEPAYGDDAVTARVQKLFEKEFGPGSRAFLVFNGTAANTLALSAMARPYDAVICSDQAHAYWDECGAPERFSGTKLLAVPSEDGKIRPEQIDRFLWMKGDQHRAQPSVISITQSTELGAVYSLPEIKAITSYAKKNGMLVHMDGARISNAAVALGLSFREFTREAGIDALSFGGTKIGLMGAEAVVFLNPELGKDFLFVRKQGMQLASKMRFLAAQFEVLFETRLWERNAKHANAMAKLLENRLREIPDLKITRPAEANAIFAILSKKRISELKQNWKFYVWNEITGEVRWMCSWDTTEDDVLRFVADVRATSR